MLSPLRSGRWGVEGLNQRIARLLHAADLIPASDGWYPGRPILVTRNDYGLGLMNGDIGITLRRPIDSDDQGWALRVAFPAGDDAHGIKWVLPSRLQSVETVYALTVHKSQGSEFTHAALILPDTLSPILTRELIYTGITRAKNWLTLAHAGNEMDSGTVCCTARAAFERADGPSGTVRLIPFHFTMKVSALHEQEFNRERSRNTWIGQAKNKQWCASQSNLLT